MKDVHLISHTHWDREWYMPFEYHRARLVKLIDDCLDLFENDLDFQHFHLDGHTILLEDYLEVKPKNKEKLKKCIQEGKFSVGPWYVLQDEFLTSSESNIRNLLVGIDIAKEFGKCSMIGYFPDTFGNVGQIPQIMKQAGMKAIVFGRGVKSVGINNSVASEEDYSSQFSELYWKSPDGSLMPAILFANWYHNGMEIPKDACEQYWDRAIKDAERYASTKELLLMNGCDHQPVQRDFSIAMKNAQKKYPDYHFIHSNFMNYADAVIKEIPKNASVICGELTSQNTDGWCTLVNTASSHVDLKIMNRKNEILLESVAEPLTVMASQYGMKFPREMLLYGWKTLMKNHPHDSICGCSCDEVNNEVMFRFQKCRQVAETIIRDALEFISKRISIKSFENSIATFSIVNTFSRERSGVVDVIVDVRRMYSSDFLHSYAEKISETAYQGEYKLLDDKGNEIPCKITKPQVAFGYELPDDGFRKAYMAERICVSFEALYVPALSYRTYGLYKVEKSQLQGSLITENNAMENEYLRVRINKNGTINIYDKKNHREFYELLRYEDVADIGNEYTFVPSPGDVPILSGESLAEIEIISDEPYRAGYKIKTIMMIPKAADESLKDERFSYVDIKNRKAGRSDKLYPVSIETCLFLEKNGKGVKIQTKINNTVRDHRLRVLIPNNIRCMVHKTESVFEVVQRNNKHNDCWTYPSGCEHQQGFLLMKDEISGMAVANIGLYEYEILKDNTIAITLVRSVGEMGDWGVFPTERSQQQKELEFTYEIVPFKEEKEVYSELASFQVPFQSIQIFNQDDQKIYCSPFEWNGDGLRMTAYKFAQNSNDVIMRWVNYSDQKQILEVKQTEWIDNLYVSNVIEERGSSICMENGYWKIKVEPYEIITLGCLK